MVLDLVTLYSLIALLFLLLEASNMVVSNKRPLFQSKLECLGFGKLSFKTSELSANRLLEISVLGASYKSELI